MQEVFNTGHAHVYTHRNKLQQDWFSRSLREVGKAAVALNVGYLVTQVRAFGARAFMNVFFLCGMWSYLIIQLWSI